MNIFEYMILICIMKFVKSKGKTGNRVSISQLKQFIYQKELELDMQPLKNFQGAKKIVRVYSEDNRHSKIWFFFLQNFMNSTS